MQIDVTLIGQMITFVLFVWFTMKLVWPPVMRALEARRAKIAEALAASDSARQELDVARHQAKVIVDEARTKASALLDQANHKAHQIVEQAEQDARDAAEKIRTSALHEIELNYRQAERELSDKVSDLAIQCAEKILQQEVNRSASETLVKKALSDVSL